jgi:hypothetical protein
MFDSDSFSTLAFSTDAWNFGGDVPAVVPPLLGRRPRATPRDRRENDEALLIALLL